MAPEAPMYLLRNQQLFGTITTYGYATPWATGKLVALQKDQHDRCIAMSAFLNWLEAASLDLSDEQYEQEMSRRGLAEENEQRWWTQWSIMTDDTKEHSISLLTFNEDGTIEWRW